MQKIGLITLGSVVVLSSQATADGIKLRSVPLHNVISSPAYAVVVDGIQQVEGKSAISAVVREVLGAGSRPIPSSSLKVGQRVELPTYRRPKPVPRKWVLAERYWNVCDGGLSKRDAVKASKRLLVSGWSYFESLCDTKAIRKKLQEIFLKENPADFYRKRATAVLRRGLGDPDTYHWARNALAKRRKLRARDIISAAHRMPDHCGANPLFDQGNQLQGVAKLAFARKVTAHLARARRSRFANFVRYQLEDAGQRSLFIAAIAQLRRFKLADAPAIRRFCTVVSPIANRLKKGATTRELNAGRKLLMWMERHKAFDEHCDGDKRRLKDAVQKKTAR